MSVTGNARVVRGPAARARGFTLIEIMVVVVIIGTIVSFAVLGLTMGRDDTVEREARRLHQVLELASEAALLEAREFGLILEPDGYRFTELDGDDWRAIEGSDRRYLNPHTLPEQVRLEAEVDGLPGEREPGESEDDRPGIMLLSSGEVTPFRLRLSDRDPSSNEHYSVRGDLTGRLELELPDEDDR